MSKPEPSRPSLDLASLVREFAPRGAPAGPCPDENLLAGYAEGRLAGEEREALESHVAQCEACRAVVVEITAAAPQAVPRAPRRWRPPMAWLAAAVLLGAVVVLASQLARSLQSGMATTEARLVAAFRELATGQPALFAGFEPLTEAERLAPGTSSERGGPALLHPCEQILSQRPTFVWEPVAGVLEYEVALSTADGNPIWRARSAGAELPFPAAERDLQRAGRYLWKLTALGPLGEETSGRSFAVVAADAATAVAASMRAIDSQVEGGFAPLVRAHFALRRGLCAAAATAARAFLAAHPGDRVGQQTLQRALVVMGASDAAAALSVHDGP